MRFLDIYSNILLLYTSMRLIFDGLLIIQNQITHNYRQRQSNLMQTWSRRSRGAVAEPSL